MPLLFSNAFISILSFPRFTTGILGLYFIVRVFYIKGYLSNRGYNKAVASEEISKLLLFVMILGGFASSLRLIGFYPKNGFIMGFSNAGSRVKGVFSRKNKAILNK
jgi:hypothetical protein